MNQQMNKYSKNVQVDRHFASWCMKAWHRIPVRVNSHSDAKVLPA